VNPFQAPSSQPHSTAPGLRLRVRLKRFATNTCIAILCLPFTVAVMILILEDPRGTQESIIANIRDFNIALFLICLSALFVALRTYLVVPWFDESRTRLAISATLIIPVCQAVVLFVQSVGCPSVALPSLCVVAGLAVAGCVIELAIAAFTLGRRRKRIA